MRSPLKMHSSNSSNENFFWDKDKNDLHFLSLSCIDMQIYCTPIQPAWGDSHCEACVDVLIWQHSAILTCWRTVSCDLHSVSSLRSGEPAGWFDLGNVYYGVITRATSVFPLIMTQSLNPAGVQKNIFKKYPSLLSNSGSQTLMRASFCSSRWKNFLKPFDVPTMTLWMRCVIGLKIPSGVQVFFVSFFFF